MMISWAIHIVDSWIIEAIFEKKKLATFFELEKNYRKITCEYYLNNFRLRS